MKRRFNFNTITSTFSQRFISIVKQNGWYSHLESVPDDMRKEICNELFPALNAEEKGKMMRGSKNNDVFAEIFKNGCENYNQDTSVKSLGNTLACISYERGNDIVNLDMMQNGIFSLFGSAFSFNPFFYFTDDSEGQSNFFVYSVINTDMKISLNNYQRHQNILSHCLNENYFFDKTNSLFPFKYVSWNFSLSGVNVMTATEGKCETDTFLTDQFYPKLKKEYFVLVLLSRYQYASCMNLLNYLEFSDSMHNSDSIVQNDIWIDWRKNSAFLNVSNEYQYQDVYSKLFEINNIQLLVEDISFKMEAIREREEKRKNQAIEKLISVISLMTIFSVLIDGTDYIQLFIEMNKIFEDTNISIIVSDIFFVLVIAFIVYICFKFKTRKCNVKRLFKKIRGLLTRR